MAISRAQKFVNRYFREEGWDVIEWANPNRHGMIILCHKDNSFIVLLEDPEGCEPYELEFDMRHDAETRYREEVDSAAATPNWEAQAEYDAVWGSPLEPYPY